MTSQRCLKQLSCVDGTCKHLVSMDFKQQALSSLAGACCRMLAGLRMFCTNCIALGLEDLMSVPLTSPECALHSGMLILEGCF